MRPPRNVPTVSTTAGASNVMPVTVTTPRTRPLSTMRSAASCWKSVEVRLVLEQRADGLLVELPVGLGAGRAHRRALAGIERAELDAGAIRGPRHGAAERVDLAHQVSLADAADGRDCSSSDPSGLDALGQEQCARPHARGRQRRLGAGMTAADDDDVVGAVRIAAWRTDAWHLTRAGRVL